MRDWTRDEPEKDAMDCAEDTRPVLDVCPVCGRNVYGGNEHYEPDDAFEMGEDIVHEECVIQYLKENGYKI